MTRFARNGIALLEVLIALAILGSAGSALLALLHQAVATQRVLHQEELELEAADRVMTAMTLLTRGDLDRRIGSHEVGEFSVGVERPEPGLYRVAVATQLAPDRELLVTVVHRFPAP